MSRFAIFCVVLLLPILALSQAGSNTQKDVYTQILPVFVEGTSTTEPILKIYKSATGELWQEPTIAQYGNRMANPNGSTRDPEMAYFHAGTGGATAGWWILHTCAGGGSPNEDVHTICITFTTDFINFCATATQLSSACPGSAPSTPTTHYIDTTATSATLHDWAPSWVKNYDGTVYLDGSGCPHVFVLLTDGTTASENIYHITPGTCSDFTAAWNTGTLINYVASSQPAILDPNVTCVHGALNGTPTNCTGTGDTFHMFYVCQSGASSEFLQYATASTVAGTYTRQNASCTVDWMGLGGNIQENPCLYHLSDRWRIYYDRIPGNPAQLYAGQMAYSDSFDFLATWSAPEYISTPGWNTTNTGAGNARGGCVAPFPQP